MYYSLLVVAVLFDSFKLLAAVDIQLTLVLFGVLNGKTHV